MVSPSTRVYLLASLLLALIAQLLPAVSAQSTVLQGALSNGVAATLPIAQGDTHSWTFTVASSQSQTGTSLTDLVFALQSSSGQSYLYLTPPGASTALQSTQAGGNGFLFTNRSGTGVQYGSYLVQVLGVATDSYTLSVSLSQRQRIVAETPLSVGAISPPPATGAAVQPFVYTYVDYVVQQAGPWQLTLSLTVDEVALVRSGGNLSATAVPTVYWARGVDVPAWSAVNSSTWSTVYSAVEQQLVSSLAALASAYDECVQPPCTYSFLVASSTAIAVPPSMLLHVVDPTSAYSPALDYSRLRSYVAGAGQSVNISTPATTIASLAVEYFQFPVYDPAVDIVLSLNATSACNLVALVSLANPLPDLAQLGYTWALSLGGNASVNISWLDPYFTTGGQMGSPTQTTTMEGMYYVTVFAYGGSSCTYQLSLSLLDPTYSLGPGAAVLPFNTLVSVPQTNLYAGQLYLRLITPPGFDPATTDIVITSTNVYQLYVSDRSSLPSYSNSFTTGFSSSGILATALISSALGQTHVGTYYLLLNSLYTRPLNVTASLVTHTPLQTDTAVVSTQPLTQGQVAFFQWHQPGLSSTNMRLELASGDATQYGDVYVTILPRATLQTPITAAWPVEADNAQWTLIGSEESAGEAMGQLNYSCAAPVDCVWLISVRATSPRGLANYTLLLQQDNADPPLVTLTANTPYTATPTQPLYDAYFVLTPAQLEVLNVTLQLGSGNGSEYSLWVDRDRSLLYGLARQPEYEALVTSGAASLAISPADPIFGVGAADNVGSPFIGTYYLQVLCWLGCQERAYTLSFTTAAYTGTAGNLEFLAVTVASPVEQSLLAGSYAYYSYTSPATVTASTDLTFAAISTAGSPTLLVSSSATFPSLAGGSYDFTASGSSAASVLLSGTAIKPSTVYYVGVLADRGYNLNLTFTVSLSTRATLTGAGSVAIADPVVAGSVAYIDLTLPGSQVQSGKPTYSFVAGVVCSTLSAGQLPSFGYASSLSSGGSSLPPTLDSSDFVPLSPTQPAPTGQFWSVGGGVCSLPSCVWHMIVLLPAGASGCSLAVSNVQTASQPISSTPLLSDGTAVTGSLSVAAVAWYAFTLPISLLTGAVVQVTLTPASSTAQFNLQLSINSQPLNPSDGASASSRGGSAARLSFNSSVAPPSFLFTAPPMLRSVYYVAVEAVTAGAFSLSASVTATTPLPGANVTAVLSVDPSVGNSSYVAALGVAVVVQFTIPAWYNATTDVLLRWESYADFVGAPEVCAVRGLSLPLQSCSGLVQLWNLTPRVWYQGTPYSQTNLFTFNSLSTPEVQPGDAIYIVTGRAGLVSLFVQQRLQLSFSQPPRALSLTAEQPILAQVTAPASKVGGSWSTPLSFIAALSTTAVPAIAPVPVVMYMRRANNAAAPLLMSPNSNTFDRVSGGTGSDQTQTLTVNDVCTLSVCTWPLIIWPNANANVSLRLTAPTVALPIVPAFPTTPAFIAQDTLTTYSFTLPHARMSAVITLTSLTSGVYAGNSTNADLFVSNTNSQPAPDTSQWSSQTDTPAGVDVVSLASGRATPNGTYYVSVFGQRAGWYSLSVTADDTATASSVTLSSNVLVGGAVNVGASQYYQYLVGQVDALTDVSLVLLDASGNQSSALPHPHLYSSFSYNEPGPVAGWLPKQLPYELTTSTSSAGGAQQITLNSALSSSNLLPLQSQHALYAAVYGSAALASDPSASQLVSYSIAVSVTERLLLSTDNSGGSAEQFTRVSAGTVQYFQFNFSQYAAAAPAASAVVVLTGERSAIDALPAAYLADPIVSQLLDPVLSTPQSYTQVMAPGAAYNALMLPLSTLCPTGGAASCLWKAMVFNALSMPSYSFAVTTHTTASTQTLLPATPVTSSALGGTFVYYSFTLGAGVNAAVLTLSTLDQVGNADLFVSATTTYPFYAFNAATGAYSGSEWQSTVDGGVSQPDMVQLNSSSGTTPSTYYVAVFAQRAAAFTLTLTLPGQQNAPSSSSSSASVRPSSSSSTATASSAAPSVSSSSSSSSRGSTAGPASSALAATSAASSPSTISLASSSSSSSSTPSSSSTSSFSTASSASPTAAPASSNSSGLSGREVALIATFVPIVAVLCLLVGLLVACLLRRPRKLDRADSAESAEHSRMYADSGTIELPTMSERPQQFAEDE